MKKKKGSRIGLALKRVFKFRYWADFDRIKAYSQYLWDLFKRLFIPQVRDDKDSQVLFEESVQQMKLSEADLKNREVALKRMSILMTVLASLVFLYSFYHLFYGSWQAALLCYSVTLIAVALAFRYHFWYFQIKERKLGCTFSEWLREGLLGHKL